MSTKRSRRCSSSVARWRYAPIAAIGILALVGCGIHHVASSEPSLPLRTATLEELARVLNERGRVGSYRALITVAAENGKGSVTVRGTVAFTAPRSFMVRGLDPLGRDLFVFSAQGEDMQLVLANKPTPLIGEDEIDAGLAPWLGSFHIDDLLEILASSHGIVIDPLETVALERGDDRYTLYVLAVSGGQTRILRKVFVERTRFLPVGEDWFDATGDRRVHVEFGPYAEWGGVWRPTSVTASNQTGTMRIHFDEVVAVR